jgi:hypothetical protein
VVPPAPDGLKPYRPPDPPRRPGQVLPTDGRVLSTLAWALTLPIGTSLSLLSCLLICVNATNRDGVAQPGFVTWSQVIFPIPSTTTSNACEEVTPTLYGSRDSAATRHVFIAFNSDSDRHRCRPPPPYPPSTPAAPLALVDLAQSSPFLYMKAGRKTNLSLLPNWPENRDSRIGFWTSEVIYDAIKNSTFSIFLLSSLIFFITFDHSSY